MRIVVDSDVLVHESKTGVYSYNQQLLCALLKLDSNNDYLFSYFGAAKSLDELGLPYTPRAMVQAISWLPRRLYNLSLRTPLGLPYDLVSGTRADLYLFTRFVKNPLWRRAKSLVFIYDTSFVDYPELLKTRHFRRYLNWAVPRTVKRVTHIVVISEDAKASLIKHYAAKPEKISVITPAVDHHHFKPTTPAEIDRIRQKYKITKPYILSLGTIEPRKNLVGLLKALLAAPAEIKASYTLVLAGSKGWLDTEINHYYDRLSQEMSVVRTGFIDNDDLPGLYAGAAVFVFVSLFEGWGMPPLEAMACGTPVITSNNSSLPEVVGEAGIMVEATDTIAITAAIQRVLTDPDLAQELRQRGLERANGFTWEQSAQLLLQVLNDMRI